MAFEESNQRVSLEQTLRSDIPASIAVFLVALPLCLGIAIASGANPIAGIIAGVIGGLVVGSISKSALGVSGPAAGMAAIVINYLNEYPYEFFLLAVVFAGIIQVLLGLIKAGVIADYFPSNVIKGMLAAIGIILIMKQIPHVLGFDDDAMGDMDYKQIDGRNPFEDIWLALSDPHFGALTIAFASLGVLILWESRSFKRHQILKLIPAPLVVVLVGSLLNLGFTGLGKQWYLDQSHLVNIPTYDNLEGFVLGLKHPDFSQFQDGLANGKMTEILFMALTIAVVASLESLLSIEATDKLDPMKRVSPPDRELVAQGTGNIISGLIGGLPITQVIVRSSANINAGGKTQLSTILHGFLLLAAVLVFPFILNTIPLACLAAILLLIGYKLANVKLFKQMYALKPRQFWPFVITIVAILFTNLLTGITVGLIISIFFILQNNRNNEPFDVKITSQKVQGKTHYEAYFLLHEEVTYLSKHILMRSLHDIPHDSEIVIDGTESRFIAQDIIETIYDFESSVAPVKHIEFEFRVKKELGTRQIDDNIINQLGGRPISVK